MDRHPPDGRSENRPWATRKRGLLFALLALFLACIVFLAPPAYPSTFYSGERELESLKARVGPRFGAVSSHIKLYPQPLIEGEVAALKDAGLSWLRCDFAWYDLEPSPGQWNFSGTDQVVQEAMENGLSLLGLLGTSPPWANGGKDWNYPPTDLTAWRNYVRTVSSRYRGKVPAWEIWNEENIPAFWQPQPDPQDYLAILAAASEEIRAVDPEACIVMGGMAGLGSDFMGECLALGAGEYVDAVAYHPYAETIGVEGQPEDDLLRPKEPLCRILVDFVHWLIAQNTQRDLQVWITEVGWTTCEVTPPGVDEDTQAAYLLRTMINYAGTDVERVLWYNLRDTHINDMDRYGLLYSDFGCKPSYDAFTTFQDIFGNTAPFPNPPVLLSWSDMESLEAHSFTRDDGTLLMALWKSDDGADLLDLRVNDPSYRNPTLIQPLNGDELPLPGVTRDTNGEIVISDLQVGKFPVIVNFRKVAVSSVSPAQAYQHTLLLNLDLTGSGFQTGAAVRLEAGSRAIEGLNVQAASEQHLTCAVTLWGVEPGDYDLMVMNPDGSKARLAAGFKVLPLCGTGSATASLTLVCLLGMLSVPGIRAARRKGQGMRSEE